MLVERGGALADGAIVVPFGAFEHDWAALEIGAWAAAALERPLRLIGAMDQGARGRDASRLLADASLIVQHTTGVVAEPLLGPPGREGVAALAEGAGLLVLGLSDRWRTEGLGEMRRGARGVASGADRARAARAASERHRAAGDADALHMVDRRVENLTSRCPS